MFKMFKRFRNTLVTSALAIAGCVTFWDVIKSSNSLLLFGEPDYPNED